jgi:hypothetical protein
MAEFPHDEFSKSYLTELLGTIGTIRPNKAIHSESRQADLWFQRNPNLTIPAQRKKLGTIGQLLTHDSLIEVFRDPADPFEIRSCRGKIIDLEGEIIRKANREKQTVQEKDLPHLWIITPTASDTICKGFNLRRTRIPGVYRFGTLDRTGLIVVHQLPVTEATLWLRILGREGIQKRAIEELIHQSEPPELYASIEELLANYRTKLSTYRTITPDEEELIMNLSAAYLKKIDEAKREGRTEGRTESHIEIAQRLLRENSPLEFISRVTDLPIATLQQLQRSL